MTVIDVGPGGLRVIAGGAGRDPDPALVESALAWIDDPIGLYDDRPVRVADLWLTIMATLAGPSGRIVVVHPDDWPAHRIELLTTAAEALAGEVRAVPRSEWSAPAQPVNRRRHRRPAVAVVAAGALAVTSAVITVRYLQPGVSPAGATVVEGRITVEVPAGWTVARITTGPGSRRLRATSPQDPALAVHITQSYAPEITPDEAAGVLARAIAVQPDGAFVGLRSDAQVGERRVATYREVRPGRVIDWSVLVVGATRIGVGCQSPPGRESEVHAACQRALTSAREKGTDPPAPPS